MSQSPRLPHFFCFFLWVRCHPCWTTKTTSTITIIVLHHWWLDDWAWSWANQFPRGNNKGWARGHFPLLLSSSLSLLNVQKYMNHNCNAKREARVATTKAQIPSSSSLVLFWSSSNLTQTWEVSCILKLHKAWGEIQNKEAENPIQTSFFYFYFCQVF